MAIEASDFLDYEITDAESYASLLRGSDMEISQLEPGPLRGHHLRAGLPDGVISWVVTNLPLRGRGRFPAGIRTLSVVVGTSSRSLQHGVEVRAGSLFHHGPGAIHDGIYGRDFSVVCLCIREELFAERLRNEFPELSDLPGQQWRVYEPEGDRQRDLVAQFEQAAIILRTEEIVRGSFAAMAAMQEELLAAFLEALEERNTPTPSHTISFAAALVRRAEGFARDCDSRADGEPLSVSDLCAGCGVPRRTLNHAFQQVLDMGPATYLRRLCLNQARRSLRRPSTNGDRKSVTEIALEHGFWHLGRFGSQYRELFGESPSASARR